MQIDSMQFIINALKFSQLQQQEIFIKSYIYFEV